MRVHHLRSLPVLLLCVLASAAAQAQVYRVAEMNTVQLKTLDRARTAVLLPGGILEQHGPYLPSFTDGYRNEWLTQKLAEAIVARPGWNVLIFPIIPLGVGGANEIGRKHVFPGTYAVRSTTLRAVFMDLATELGEQGFRWVFVVHGHGAPNHQRMLEQASDYFRDTYGGHMVQLLGLMPPDDAPSDDMSEAERQEDGFTVHAGASETSILLFLRPNVVGPGVHHSRPQTGHNWDDLVQLARAPGWPGYFGSPRLATAARGARIAGDEAKVYIDFALKILDGADERQIPRFSDLASKSAPNVAIDRDAIEREREIQKRQQSWLQKHNLQ
jgi:creatinine amidohydrolase/Fe(II)-dependent formamide hydrolase-like protein